MLSDKKNNQKLIFVSGYFILTFFAIFMITRAKIGYIYNDEPFILTLAYKC